MGKNITATVDQLIAAETVSANNARGETLVLKDAPVAPVAPVAPTTVARGITSIAVDGFTMHFEKNATIDVATLRDLVIRETDNAWYPVVTVLSKCNVGILTVTRDGDAKTGAKSPLARINSAIARAERIRKDAMLRGVKPAADVLNAHKIVATGHKTEKGVWRIVRLP